VESGNCSSCGGCGAMSTGLMGLAGFKQLASEKELFFSRFGRRPNRDATYPITS